MFHLFTTFSLTYETENGVKCSTSRIFDNPRNNKRRYDRNPPETFHSQSSKIEQTSSEAADEIRNLIQNSICADSHMQVKFIFLEVISAEIIL